MSRIEAFFNEDPALRSKADVWYVKHIYFNGKRVPIITQNFSGPCSFITICNILILRGDIVIEPPTRQTVSYEFLSHLVAEYLLIHSPDVDVSAALSMLPHTQKGIDLNPIFTSPSAFRVATETAGGELALFSQVGINLVHGWLVHPDSDEARAMREEGAEDYDSAVGLIAEADHLAGGLIVPENDEGDDMHKGGSSGQRQVGGYRQEMWTDVESRKVRNALIIRRWLEQTHSQLTYHGLFHLASTLPSGELTALFRGSHLYVLYKLESSKPEQGGASAARDETWEILDDSPPVAGSPKGKSPALRPVSPPTPTPEVTPTPQDPFADPAPAPASVENQEPPKSATQSHIYTLATDQTLLHKPFIVWERIEDVDAAGTVFVDGDFQLEVATNGDWAAWFNQGAINVPIGQGVVTDFDIARQLQAEENSAQLARRLQEDEEQRALQAFLYRERVEQQEEELRRRERNRDQREEEARARRATRRWLPRRREGEEGKCVIM